MSVLKIRTPLFKTHGIIMQLWTLITRRYSIEQLNARVVIISEHTSNIQEPYIFYWSAMWRSLHQSPINADNNSLVGKDRISCYRLILTGALSCWKWRQGKLIPTDNPIPTDFSTLGWEILTDIHIQTDCLLKLITIDGWTLHLSLATNKDAW